MRLFRLGILLLLTFISVNVSAQTAKQILDKAAQTFRNAGGVAVTYNYSSQGQSGEGVLKMKDGKFTNAFGDFVLWFNGTTLWTLVRSNEEVNVTTPSAQEINRMNPYAFLSLYKKNYNLTKGPSGGTYNTVELRAKSQQAQLQHITIRIDKRTNHPTLVTMTGGNYNAKITVNSVKSHQPFNTKTFTFQKSAWPDVDVIDLRH